MESEVQCTVCEVNDKVDRQVEVFANQFFPIFPFQISKSVFRSTSISNFQINITPYCNFELTVSSEFSGSPISTKSIKIPMNKPNNARRRFQSTAINSSREGYVDLHSFSD